jgi:diaminopimelate epimerase
MIAFTKGHAYGNDFLYVDQSAVGERTPAQLALELCDRHTGIGADGLILYTRTANGAAMSLLNADGSRAEVSGNGLRGLATLLMRGDGRHGVEVTIQTEAGSRRLRRIGGSDARPLFRAAMGLPTDLRQVRIMVGGESLEAVVLNMGNPQCVLVGRLPDEERFRRLGASLEHHMMFPGGTNVGFAHVEAANRVRVLIWERGCGPTASSGTGSCAALVAAATFGGAAREAEILAPGGAQRVEWLDDSVYLTGWAEILCEGHWLRPPPATELTDSV